MQDLNIFCIYIEKGEYNMKRTLPILTLLLLFFPSILKAHWLEDYGFYFDSDNTFYVCNYFWHGQNNDFNNHGAAYVYSYYTYKPYNKNGKIYHSVIALGNSKDGWYMITLPDPQIIMGIRQEDGRIYVDRQEYIDAIGRDIAVCQENQKYSNVPLNPVGNKDYLPYKETYEGELVLYDFNLQPGDKYLSVEGYDDISVVSVEIWTTRDGVNRRLLTLSNGYKLLEGVGCLNSPGMFFYYLNPSEVMTRYYASCVMTKCYSFGKDDTIIYECDDELTGTKNVRFSSADSTIQYYDLQGRRLTKQPRKGVYIRDGRKVVVK